VSFPPSLTRPKRIGLLRLHAEHQVLKQVLGIITRGVLRYQPGSSAADRLDTYLNEATRFLGRKSSGGVPFQTIREEFLSYEGLVRPEERQILAEKLRQVRRQVRRKVEAYVDGLPRNQVRQADGAASAAATVDGAEISPPFPAWRGAEPYIFVSYAHKDRHAVYPSMAELHRRGYRIWYDEGIVPGAVWPERLADAIERSSCFLLFVSPRLVASRHCLDEVFFAIERGKPVVAVHLEKTDLPSELAFLLGRRQAILRYKMDSQRFWNQLEEAIPRHLTDAEMKESGLESAVRSAESD
jgi:hypothetical protein